MMEVKAKKISVVVARVISAFFSSSYGMVAATSGFSGGKNESITTTRPGN